MTEDRKNYVLKADTGNFHIVPGTLSLAANTAIIAYESLSSPREMSVISPALAQPPQKPSLPPGTLGWQTRDDARDDPNAIVLSRHFKLVFISVLAITVFAGLAPLCTRKRTQVGHRAISEKCHKQTSAENARSPM
jgi:hypothetical protein